MRADAAPWRMLAAAGTFLLCGSSAGCRIDERPAFRPVDLEPWTPTRAAHPAPAPAGAPAPASGLEGERRITLEEVLELAASEAVAIQIARQRAVEALARESVEGSAWIPTLSPGGVFAAHDGRLQATEGEILDVRRQSLFVGAGVELSLNPAEVRYRQRAAGASAAAALEGIRAAAHDVLFEASRRYFDLLESHARVHIAEEALRHAEELLLVTESRVRQGAAVDSDRLRALARRAETQRNLSRARNDADLSSAVLAELLLLDESLRLVPGAPATRAVELVPDESLEELLAMSVDSRPELAEARARIEALKEDEGRASHAWLFPELFGGLAAGGFGANFGDLGDREDAYVGLRWELGAGIPGTRRAAAAARRAAELSYVAVQHRIAREVVAAHRNVQSAREEIEAAASEVGAARGAREQATARHREGAALLIEVLDAEVGLTRAETALATATADFNRAQFGLLRAVGATSER